MVVAPLVGYVAIGVMMFLRSNLHSYSPLEEWRWEYGVFFFFSKDVTSMMIKSLPEIGSKHLYPCLVDE